MIWLKREKLIKMKDRIKNIFPNTLTLLNLLSGTVGIILSFKGDFINASIMIFLGSFFDFFDGFIARLLKTVNPIGKDLDSLADIITFGLLPSFILYNYLSDSILSNFVFLIVLFSALRLAKFNNDTSQTLTFKGLPTPALAIFFASFIISLEKGQISFCCTNILLIGLAVFMSILLILPLPMKALKFKEDFSWQKNRSKYIFIFLAIILIIVFKYIGISLSVFLYIFYSLVYYKF